MNPPEQMVQEYRKRQWRLLYFGVALIVTALYIALSSAASGFIASIPGTIGLLAVFFALKNLLASV